MVTATIPAHGSKLNLIPLTNGEGAPVRQRKDRVTHFQTTRQITLSEAPMGIPVYGKVRSGSASLHRLR